MFTEGKWFTTVMGIAGGILMALGVFLPEKFDPETQASINEGLKNLLLAIGAIIEVVSNLIAKDPETVTKAFARK